MKKKERLKLSMKERKKKKLEGGKKVIEIN